MTTLYETMTHHWHKQPLPPEAADLLQELMLKHCASEGNHLYNPDLFHNATVLVCNLNNLDHTLYNKTYSRHLRIEDYDPEALDDFMDVNISHFFFGE